MELRNISIAFASFCKDGPAILTDVAPDHPYRDGKQVKEEVVGRKVTVVFPANAYDTLTVKVADPTDALTTLLRKATPDAPVYVDFENFSASVYAMRSDDGRFKTGVSAKADAVRVVPSSDAFSIE